jgi:CDP-glucose 4,6-dehydratase
MIDLLRRVYRHQKVLVTGSTGFKGAWLALWLRTLGARVIGYALEPPTQPSLFEAIGLGQEILQIYADIRDYAKLQAIVEAHEPQMVFHLAAQSLVRLSYLEPRLTFETNVQGTVNLLEAVRHSRSVQAVVNVTSDKCYENREWVWSYRENDPLGGYDPYSSSKGCAELANAAYLRSFFNPEDYGRRHQVALASARAGNVIGGGDWGPDRLVSDCIRALTAGQDIVIRNPRAIRPWQHVLDPLGGYLLLGAKLATDGSRYAGPWNFAPLSGQVWTVEEMVNKVITLWGQGNYKIAEDSHFHEAQCLQLDCSKAMIELGWRPRYDLEQALDLTIAWYRQFYSRRSSSALMDFTLAQINQYEEVLS